METDKVSTVAGRSAGTRRGPEPASGRAVSGGQRCGSWLACFSVDGLSQSAPTTSVGRAAEARSLIDQTLADDRRQLPPSAINKLLEQRILMAGNLEEFLQLATQAGRF